MKSFSPLLLVLCCLLATYCSHAQQVVAADTAEYKGLSNINYLDDRDTLLDNLWIDTTHRFAADIKNKEHLVTFYRFVNGKWKVIGKRKTAIDIVEIDFEDLNGDGVNEVMIGTGNNMNGNHFYEAFIYNPGKDAIQFAGSFSSQYTIDTKHRTIAVDYEGSWYMDRFKELYKWHGYKLVLERQVVLHNKDISKQYSPIYIQTYKNLNPANDKMTLIEQHVYQLSSKRDKQLWDGFFKMH